MQPTLFKLETKAEHRFRVFHYENPKVYRRLVELAYQAKNRGKTKIGIGMLFEILRWEYFLETNDPDFKLNNNYRSRYSRLIIESEPELENMFNLRELRS